MCLGADSSLQTSLRDVEEQPHGACPTCDDSTIRCPDADRGVLLRRVPLCTLDVSDEQIFVRQIAKSTTL